MHPEEEKPVIPIKIEKENIVNILLIVGGTCSGKTTIKKMIMNSTRDINMNKFSRVVFADPIQFTTRTKREEERADDYIYIDNDYAQSLIMEDKSITALTTYNDNTYGTFTRSIVKGSGVINLIVANRQGMQSVIDTYKDDPSVIIKTMLVLSNINEKLANERGRTMDFCKNEMFDLIRSNQYDYYLPNYIDKRATTKDIIKVTDHFNDFK